MSTKQLNISPDLSLPIEAVTQTFAILAKKGSGKTYSGSVLAEEMLAAGQVMVAVDPTGAWWGLRSSADGKKPGYPVVVFGGDHGDLPLNPLAGEMIAQAIAAKRFPAVLDLSLLRKAESIRFVTAFMETLYRLNREPLHLFIDEADDLCPQRMQGDEARMVGAVEDVVKRGRKKGIGCTLITQRPADLNKQVLTQCEVLFALNISHPKDIAPINEWVRVHADESQAKQMISDLPSLPKGEGWIWSPSWLNKFQRIKIRTRHTFDSGATPKVGQVRIEPKRLAEIDVNVLGQEMAKLADEAKANDPKELKRRIAELERAASVKPAPIPVQNQTALKAQLNAEYERGKNDGYHLGVNQMRNRVLNGIAQPIIPWLKETAESLIQDKPKSNAVNKNQMEFFTKVLPQIAKPYQLPKPQTETSSEVGKGGLRRILIALAQRPGLSNRQIGVRAGLSSSSGTFGTYIAKARSSGWIRDEGERRFITDEGLAALGDYEPLPSGQALLNYWLGELGNSGAARILQALAEYYPVELSTEQVGAKAGISHTSGTFGTYLSKLRTLELISGGRGMLKASDELFD